MINVYNFDYKFLKKLGKTEEQKYIITKLYAVGKICDSIEFNFIKSKIYFNWENLSMRIAINKEDRLIMLELYTDSMWIGEWGPQNTSIVFMEIEGDGVKIKSKKIQSVKEIFKIVQNLEFFSITVYYETSIREDPSSENYAKNNNIWISYIGGLYHMVDPVLLLEDNKADWKSRETYEEGRVVESNYENFYELCAETAKTAKEMKENNLRWELFKYQECDIS